MTPFLYETLKIDRTGAGIIAPFMSQTYGEKPQRAFSVYLSPVVFARLGIERLSVWEPGVCRPYFFA